MFAVELFTRLTFFWRRWMRRSHVPHSNWHAKPIESANLRVRVRNYSGYSTTRPGGPAGASKQRSLQCCLTPATDVVKTCSEWAENAASKAFYGKSKAGRHLQPSCRRSTQIARQFDHLLDILGSEASCTVEHLVLANAATTPGTATPLYR